jgi:hypothetical protein
MEKPDKIETCASCGTTDPSVEANGIWHCPNALCRGVGAHWFRRRLKSYKDNVDSTHSVNEDELQREGKRYMRKKRFHDLIKRWKLDMFFKKWRITR